MYCYKVRLMVNQMSLNAVTVSTNTALYCLHAYVRPSIMHNRYLNVTYDRIRHTLNSGKNAKDKENKLNR